MAILVARIRASHKQPMPGLFDTKLRAMRHARARRDGAATFLHERAFEDCLERIAIMDRRFERALLIGEFGSDWTRRLGSVAANADAFPENRMEDAWHAQEADYDLIVAIGTLDTINDLPLALRLIRHALRPNGLFIGAFAGGDTLPQLRAAMRVADSVTAAAAPHVHPRIEPAAVAPLLEQAGFVRTVVDVDRVRVSYPSLSRLVADLRAMGASNMLVQRPRFVGKAAYAAARRAFAEAGQATGRTEEIFEVVHFAAWTAAGSAPR